MCWWAISIGTCCCAGGGGPKFDCWCWTIPGGGGCGGGGCMTAVCRRVAAWWGWGTNWRGSGVTAGQFFIFLSFFHNRRPHPFLSPASAFLSSRTLRKSDQKSNNFLITDHTCGGWCGWGCMITAWPAAAWWWRCMTAADGLQGGPPWASNSAAGKKKST